MLMDVADENRPRGDLRPPELPKASPLAELVCPLGEAVDPRLTTPLCESAEGDSMPGGEGRWGELGQPKMECGGLSQVDSWAWEMGSEVSSVPSAWSHATSRQTDHSTVKSISSATGDGGLIPGLVDGQRLSSVKPVCIPKTGGKVVVSLRKEVPAGYWHTLSVVLVNLPVQVTLKPTAIKKGRKLCIDIPKGLNPDDYDVRLKFGEKIIHGSIPLQIGDGDDNGDMEEQDEDGD